MAEASASTWTNGRVGTFKEAHTLEERTAEAAKARREFPGRIPVIVERAAARGSVAPAIDRSKFLVPGDLTMGAFIFLIRKRLHMPPERALFVFVRHILPTNSALMRELHATYADEDGFLYVLYTGESTFGV